MAKKKIETTAELTNILGYETTSYRSFKEKATTKEINDFMKVLSKKCENAELSSVVLEAFKKDIEKTLEIKYKENAQRRKERNKLRKEDEKEHRKEEKDHPFAVLSQFFKTASKTTFKEDAFQHYLSNCLEYLSTNINSSLMKNLRDPGAIIDTSVFRQLQRLDAKLAKKYEDYFFAEGSIQNNEYKVNKYNTPTKKSLRDKAKDLAKASKGFKYTSSKDLEPRSQSDNREVEGFLGAINSFADTVNRQYKEQQKAKKKKAPRNNITAEQEVENKTTTAYKQTEEIRDIQDDVYKPRATEVEEFHINIGFGDNEKRVDYNANLTDEEWAAIQEAGKAYEQEQKRIQELDEEIAYGGYEHWDEARFDEYFSITNAFKQIELIKKANLADDHKFLIKHFKPEYLALWPEKFSNPDFLNEVSKQANIDDVQKLLFMFTEDPTIFNKYDKTAPKSADKFLALLNTYMQRVAGGKEKDAGSFKNLQYLFDKLYPNGKAICPQLEQYEGFLNSILNKDINYENLKKWKKSLPKQFQKKLEENAKKSRAETLTNKQMDSKLAEIRDAEAPNGKPLDWSKDTIKYFIENAIGSTFNGQPFYSDNVNRMFKVLSPETLEKLDHNFKVSVFNPEFLTKDESRKVFDESVIKDFVRKGSLHEAKRMLFMYAHHREMMPADVYLACLAEFTDRLMTTKNQTERANFYSLRGLCDSLFPEKETGNNPLLPYKNIIENMFEVNEASYAKGYGAWKRSVPKNSVENLKAKAEKAEKARKDKISQEERIKSDPELRSKTFHRETLRKLGQIVTDSQFENMKASELEDWVNRLLHIDNNANEDEGDELD